MSSEFGSGGVDVSGSNRLLRWDRADTIDTGPVMHRSLTYSGGGRGPLGLAGGHREAADLIRRSEVLAARGDEEALHDTAQRVVQTLVRHIDEERPRFQNVGAAQRGRLLAGQQALLDCATRFATNLAPDAGANLLALLVRQADNEEAAVYAENRPTVTQPSNSDQFAFITDWAIAAPLVGSS
jgi:hypothetical protein